MVACGLACLAVVIAAGAPPAGVTFVAVSPLLVGELLVLRFDLWPALLAVAGLAALLRDRARLGMAALAAACAAKAFALVLLPLAAVWTLRRRGRRELLAALAVFALVLALAFGPFAVLAPGGLWTTLHEQAARAIQIESLAGSVLMTLGPPALTESLGAVSVAGYGWVAALSTAVEAAVLVALWIAFARGPAERERLLRYAAACVCAFVALGKVLSPQYLIWLVPLVPLVRRRRGAAAMLLLAAALVVTQWYYDRYESVVHHGLAWVVLVRDLILLVLLAVLAAPQRARARQGGRYAAATPGRLASLALLAAAALLAGSAGAARAAARVVGGTALQVQSAPWAVSIRQTTGPNSSILCSGAIVDPLHVLTAAHCVYDQHGAPAPATALSVRAGISNYESPQPTDAEQDRGVSSVRVHPGYTWSTGARPDDVALLALSAPLDLNGTTVAAAPLPSPDGRTFPGSTAVELAGFGRESAGASAGGSLELFTGTTERQGTCGGWSNEVVPAADAIAFCASSPTESVCSGDSGSALVTAAPPHTIVGVAIAGAPGCAPGSQGVFVNVEAPEILGFVQGNDQPATAPRSNPTTYVDLYAAVPLHVGSVVTCRSGNWEGSATLSYTFVDTRTGQVLAQGPRGSLTLTARDVGDTLACTATATNAGGSAVLTTSTTGAVAPAPALALERVEAAAAVPGRPVRIRVWLDPARGLTGKYGVCITPPPRVGGRACASRRIAVGSGRRVALDVTLHVRRSAPPGRARLSVTAAAGPSHGHESMFLRISRGRPRSRA